MLGAKSPFSSWTRSPTSTRNCRHGLRGPGARLVGLGETVGARPRSTRPAFIAQPVNGWVHRHNALVGPGLCGGRKVGSEVPRRGSVRPKRPPLPQSHALAGRRLQGARVFWGQHEEAPSPAIRVWPQPHTPPALCDPYDYAGALWLVEYMGAASSLGVAEGVLRGSPEAALWRQPRGRPGGFGPLSPWPRQPKENTMIAGGSALNARASQRSSGGLLKKSEEWCRSRGGSFDYVSKGEPPWKTWKGKTPCNTC